MKLGKIFLILTIGVTTIAGQTPEKPSSTNDDGFMIDTSDSLLLAERTVTKPIGTFDSYCSLLYAAEDFAIHTSDSLINNTKLTSPFPKYYQPTFRQILDTIAFQTASSWKYDPSTKYWVFAKPALKKPYSVRIADKWETKNMGIYDGYKPPNFPVGMDIYYYGLYTADRKDDEAGLWENIRNTWALNFATKFDPNAVIEKMKKVKVNNSEALYFESPTPRPGTTWRQWAVVKNGKAFVIVSVLPNTEDSWIADVKSMVDSFAVTP